MMFAPERMIQMDLLTLSEEAEHIAALLSKEGTVHIAERELPARGDSNGAANGAPTSARAIERLESLADALLQRLDLAPRTVEGGILESFLEVGIDRALAQAEQGLDRIGEGVDAHFGRRHEAETAIAHLNEISEQMHLLRQHGLSFLTLRKFTNFYAVCGTLDRTHAGRLADQLETEPCALATRPALGQGIAFLLIGDGGQSERFETLLKNAGARSLKPPERFEQSFEDGMEQVEIELWVQRDRLAELAREFDDACAVWHKELSELKACLRMMREIDEASAHFGRAGTVTLISGFVPASRKVALVRRLERDAANRYYARFVIPDPGTVAPPPTLLRNPRIFRPFELFVKTYGLPGYNDIDPTPVVAVSFLAMFGMMFGDVGHGLVLAAIGAGIAFLPYNIFSAVRDLGRILLMAGLSGTIFGFLFGSVFGIENDSVLPALWMRPSHPENLTAFLGAALGLGVAVLSVGILLNIFQALRHKDRRKALIGQWSAASLVFFWSLLALFAMSVAGKNVPLPTVAVIAALLSPLCLVAVGQIVFAAIDRRRRAAGHEGAGAHEEEVATILFEPIEIVMNLFTNSVSFLRVAAFGLAHAALTAATFVIKDMLRAPAIDMFSMPVEHLFIIVLEGMIVTIQCLRLEYYEFFSKFFVGNGVAYEPLAIRPEGKRR